MEKSKIKAMEDDFNKNLKDSNGTIFTIDKDKCVDLGDGVQIIELKAPFNTFYYSTKTEKTKICLHFTVGILKGDIATMTRRGTKVSVNYVIDRCGRIYHLFDDAYWSYHLGAKCIGTNAEMSKHTIGIEVSNYGPLVKKNDGYYDAYSKLFTNDDSFVDNIEYRGFDYYEKLTSEQEKSITKLLEYLTAKHNIQKTTHFEMFEKNDDAIKFNGIICHTSVRSDKYDYPPQMLKFVEDWANPIVEEKVAEPTQETAQETAQETKEEPIAESAQETQGEVIEEVKVKNITIKVKEKQETPIKIEETKKAESTNILQLILDIICKIFGK